MDILKRSVFIVLLLILPEYVHAQVPLEQTRFKASQISPLYFGPYAFPVPAMASGQPFDNVSIELSGDEVVGILAGKDKKDYTYAPTFRITLPLWTDRAALTVWGEFHEFYHDTEATRQIRRVSDNYPLEGNDSGNLYFSIDFLLLKERQSLPSFTVRAATLTATGDQYEVARHYDAPGYFFDGTLGKSFPFSDNLALRLSAAAGFLCWQIDRGTQNDAIKLDAGLSLYAGPLSLALQYGQYKGAESGRDIGIETPGNPSCGDHPQTISGRMDVRLGDFSPFIYIHHGLNDWPFTQFRIGVKYNIPIAWR